jgi:hypothetical protein
VPADTFLIGEDLAIILTVTLVEGLVPDNVDSLTVIQ